MQVCNASGIICASSGFIDCMGHVKNSTSYVYSHRDFSILFFGPNFGPIPNGKSAYIFPKSR